MKTRARTPWFLVMTLASLLPACGGGGEGGGSPQDPQDPQQPEVPEVPAAPSALAYALSPAVYSRGIAILPNSPTHGGGEVESFSVAPELPAGLALDAGTGAITGTPTALAAEAAYVVTAKNSGGSTTASLRLSVVEPLALAYELQTASYMRWVAVEPNAPTPALVGATYSVSPPLPDGLALDAATGVVSGTPAVAATAADYTVVARTSTGSAGQAVLHLDVADGNPTLALSPGVPDDAGIAALVSAHNAVRHGPLDPLPDPELPNLVWDPRLAQVAKGWADGCHHNSTSQHLDQYNPSAASEYQALGGSGTVGENRFSTSSSTGFTVGAVLGYWILDAADFDYDVGCVSGGGCGYYTQLVWRATTRVGCAVVDCPAITMRYSIVCNYSPAGNLVDQRPY